MHAAHFCRKWSYCVWTKNRSNGSLLILPHPLFCFEILENKDILYIYCKNVECACGVCLQGGGNLDLCERAFVDDSKICWGLSYTVSGFSASCRQCFQHVFKQLVLVFRDSTDMKQRAERINESRFDRLGAKQKKQMVAKPYEGLVRQRHYSTASLPFVEATVLSLFCVAAAVLVTLAVAAAFLVTLTVLLLLFLSPSLCCCCCSCHPHCVATAVLVTLTVAAAVLVTLTVLLLLFLSPSLCYCRCSCHPHCVAVLVTLTVLLPLFLSPSLSGCRVSGCQALKQLQLVRTSQSNNQHKKPSKWLTEAKAQQ